MNRAKWYQWHSWVGLKLAILICFVLVTGTFATLSHELDWLTNPAMRVSQVEDETVDWAGIYAAARAKNPDAQIEVINAPVDAWFAAEVVYRLPDGERARWFYHPQTAQFQGHGRWYNWQRFFRMTHRHLMMPIPVGVTLVSLTALLMLTSLVTGLGLHKKWWQGLWRLPRRNNAKVFWGDLHRLLGLWGSWLLLLLCITGIWYLLEVWGLNADYPDDGRPVTELAKQQRVLPEPETFSSMLSQLRQQRPDMHIGRVLMPFAKDRGVRFDGQAGQVLVRDRANNMVFDPVSGVALSSRYGEDLGLHVRISEAADPLHFGTFGGLPTKILYFVFGAVLSTLAVSGTYIYGMRAARISRRTEKPVRQSWAATWQGMGRWRWLSLALLSVCIILVAIAFI